ncbi:MAG: GtrA family protein [Gammaproteobacteria bacterium]|nr:GtrA family protein [Gammaproteobacteria bacterium]
MKLYHQYRLTLLQIFRFGSIGILILIFNYLSFETCYSLLNIDYRIAVSVAYVFSVLLHFFLNKRFTFEMHHTQSSLYIIRYLIMLGVNYIAVMFLTHFIVETLHQSPRFIYIISPFITSTISFSMMKFFVFKGEHLT